VDESALTAALRVAGFDHDRSGYTAGDRSGDIQEEIA